MLAAAAALFVGACLVLVLAPTQPITTGLVFVVPVAVIASELGTRAGLVTAALSVVAVLTWRATGLGPSGPAAEISRSLALFFLAWVLGRTSDRAARSRGLLELLLGATTDAIYVKDLDGRYLVVNSPAAHLLGRPAEQILGHSDRDLVPEAADELAGRDAEVLMDLAPVTFEISGTFGSRERVLSVTQSPFRDSSGALVGTLGIARDITEQRRMQERFEEDLRRLADRDPLTGLYNRRRFGQELDRHVAEVARHGPRGALLVLDLDNFKYVNDAFGHHAGDELIRSVATILRERVRASDVLARLGGDEFAVLLPNADRGEAEIVAADLVRRVREHANIEGGEGRRRVTASVGVAPFGDGSMNGDQMLIAADLAMYEAKSGRDRFVVVPPGLQRQHRLRARARLG